MDVLITIDHNSKDSFQQQIADQIVAFIVAKKLNANDRLPSSRSLSTELNLSRNTIKGAYEKLAELGYVQLKLGSGCYVTERVPDESIYLSKTNSVNEHVESTVFDSPLSSCDTKATNKLFSRRYNQSYLDFQIERSDPESFPAVVWRRLANRQLAASRSGMSQYAAPEGKTELREAIATRLSLTRGMSVTAAQVLIITGIQQGLNIIAHMFIQNSRKQTVIGIEAPGFAGASLVFENYGATLQPLPIDEQGLVIDSLPDTPLTLAMVTPSRQFPLCATLPVERRKSLMEWANKQQTYVLEVDYDSDFRYEEPPLPAVKHFDSKERVICLGSFTKSIGPGLRIGYMVLPERLMPEAVSCKSLLDYAMPWLDQSILTEFMLSGAFEQHLKTLRQRYLMRRNTLQAALNHHFPRTELRGLESGTFIVWQLMEGMIDAESLKVAAAQRQLGIYTLQHHTVYAPDALNNYHQIVLLGYAALNEVQINQAVAELSRCVTT